MRYSCVGEVGTTEVLAGALTSLSAEAEPLGLRVSWIKTEVQAVGEILDATFESIPVSGDARTLQLIRNAPSRPPGRQNII